MAADGAGDRAGDARSGGVKFAESGREIIASGIELAELGRSGAAPLRNTRRKWRRR